MPKNKLFRYRQLKTFANVLQPPFATPPGWRELFGNANPLTLELACGAGAYTLGLATLFPQRNFIGLDIKGARLWQGAKYALEQKLSNVKFLRVPIEQVDAYFAENEISEIWITFPDPFPKPRTAKHRLTHPRFLQLYQKILTPGGTLHLKTDDLNLFNYSVETIADAGFRLTEMVNNIYATSNISPLLAIQTVYEKKHLAAGRQIHYLKATE